MTDPTPATVAVPVELLTRILGKKVYAPSELRALLPKPTPRLVAVDIAGFDDDEGVFGVRYLKTQPDLLALLDDVLAETVDSLTARLTLRIAIRAALGVDE